MAIALPLVDVLVAGLQAGGSLRPTLGLLARRVPRLLRATRGERLRLVGDLLAPYGRVLDARLGSDLTRGPVAAFAAHAGAGPLTPGGALFAFWQAAYHRFGQWHASGGSGALTAALVRRLEALDGRVRCSAPVARIDATGGRVRGAVLDTGEWMPTDVVVAAIDPRTALLELADPAPIGPVVEGLRAAHRSNAVQAVVHVAVDRLPPYRDARPGDWNGLQSFVDSLDSLRAGFAAAEARRLPPSPVPAYAFTPSALDATLAPAGRHTVYLACPAAPFEVEGGWTSAAPRLVEDLLDQVEHRAPGFRDSVVGVHVRTPAEMAHELRWPGAHPMVLDVTPDQLGPLRPTAALADHRTPTAGLYLGGAGTAPVGGIAGAPGRAAALAVLADLRARGVPGRCAGPW